MTFRKWLSALLAVIMVCAMIPAALMEGNPEDAYEEVAAVDVDALDEELVVALDEEEAEATEEVSFDLAVPETVTEEIVDEPAEEELPLDVEPDAAIVKGIVRTSANDGSFKVENGVLTAYTGSSNNVVIPDVVTDKDDATLQATVLDIADTAFKGNLALLSVTIPTHVQTISESAFEGCTALKTVTFAADSWLESLGNSSFSGCHSLETIALPKAINTIPYACFAGCDSLLGEIDLSNITTINDYGFQNCRALVTIDMPKLANIGANAFEGCTWLKDFVAGKNCNILDNAFKNCTRLSNVDLSQAKYVAPSAFTGCNGITAITVSSGITAQFTDCANLTKVIIADNGNHEIANSMLTGMSKVIEVVIPDTITKIGDYAFEGTGLKALPTMNGVTHIGYRAFANLAGLEKVTIPQNIQTVGGAVFEGCTKLKEVILDSGEKASYSKRELVGSLDMNAIDFRMSETAKAIPNDCYRDITVNMGERFTKIDANIIKANIVTIGARAFLNCSNVNTLEIPANVKYIGDDAFSGLNLDELVIPETVLEIGARAFKGSNIKKLTISSGLTKIGENAFEDCNFTEVTLPDTVTYVGNSIFNNCDYLKTINVKTGYLTQYEGGFTYNNLMSGTHASSIVLAEGSKSIPRYFYEGVSSLTEITIPSSVNSIGWDAFYNCTGLTKIVIPGTVDEIEIGAFFGCIGLKEVTIENGVKAIGYDAFYGCTSLATITIADSVKTIGSHAFVGCKALTSITLPASLDYSNSDNTNNYLINLFYDCEKLETVDLSACTKLNGIEEEALYNLPALTEVKLPETIKTIESRAFVNDEKLTTINLDHVSKISAYAFNGCKALAEVTLKNKAVVLENGAIPMTTTIKCYNGSEGIEAYAKKNGNTIVPLDPMKGLDISIRDGVTSFDYTGAAIEPTVDVKDGTKVLTVGTDYTLSFANNVNPGTATITVTGLGNYEGADEESSKRTLEFAITSSVKQLTVAIRNADVAPSTFFYTGSAIQPKVIVKDGNTQLKEGTDYNLTYANNINEGTGTVNVNVTKAGFGGTLTVNFTIDKSVVNLYSKSQKYTENKGVKFNIVLEAGLSIVKCKSNKAAVATVTDTGLVTTNGIGKATITVTMSNKKTRKLVLTVVDPTAVTSISFEQKGTQKLVVDETLQLDVIMQPEDTYDSDVIWKSSNPKVATVDEDGEVTALKKGSVTITATPTNPAKKSLKAKIKIKVSNY